MATNKYHHPDTRKTANKEKIKLRNCFLDAGALFLADRIITKEYVKMGTTYKTNVGLASSPSPELIPNNSE